MFQPSLRDFIAFDDNFPSDESLGYFHDVPLGRSKGNDVAPQTNAAREFPNSAGGKGS
jgi:hypothetical protein